jgi:hypothetical protein
MQKDEYRFVADQEFENLAFVGSGELVLAEFLVGGLLLLGLGLRLSSP